MLKRAFFRPSLSRSTSLASFPLGTLIAGVLAWNVGLAVEGDDPPSLPATAAESAPPEIPIYGPPLPAGFEDPLAPASGPVDVLRVVQRATGVPNSTGESGTRQVEQAITVAEGGERVLLEQYTPAPKEGGDRRLESRIVLRLDRQPPIAWEFGPDGETYREHEGDLNAIQRDRTVREREVLRRATRMPAAERDQILEQNHLRLDGKREVKVRWGETSSVLDSTCRELVVTENGRTIIDACISEEAAGGQSFFQLYRRLGAFSQEVLDAIRDVKGLPLRGSITVVTKLPVYTFDFVVEDIERTKVDAKDFELPPGATELVETPAIVRCPTCQKELEAARGQKFTYGGRTLYFCDNECLRKFKASLRERLNPNRKDGAERGKATDAEKSGAQ